MFRACLRSLRVSAPVPRPISSSDQLSRESYGNTRGGYNKELSLKYDKVTEENRYESLDLILETLSTHKGRRQYPMRLNLRPLGARLRQMQLDWHDLKTLPRSERLMVFDALRLTPAQRTILALALHAHLCGVLTQSSLSSAPQTYCTRAGRVAHGGRCGEDGHTASCYFEHKLVARSAHSGGAAGSATHAASLSRHRSMQDGVVVETRAMPPLEIVGRRRQEYRARVWEPGPGPSRFVVQTMGFDFRVHPEDPRYDAQVIAPAVEWDTHAEKLRHVLGELLEVHGTEKGVPQPLEIRPGELQPDMAYTLNYAPDPDGTVVEYRMVDQQGVLRPWFMVPPPQRFLRGVPVDVPFAPSVIIKVTANAPKPEGGKEEWFSDPKLSRAKSTSGDGSSRSQQPESNRNSQKSQSEYISPTLAIDDPGRLPLQVTIMVHDLACFRLPPEKESTLMQYLVDYASQIPFSLPFYLYYRVDSIDVLRANPDVQQYQRNMLSAEKNGLNFRVKKNF